MMRSSLFVAHEREAKRNKSGNTLQVLDRYIDFAALAAKVDHAAPRPDWSRSGQMLFPTEVIMRILLLQELFHLSDAQMEFQLLDRMSFLRFARLAGTSHIPDRTTIRTFMERLVKAGSSENVFDAVNCQLAKHGYIARGGQTFDVSTVLVPRQSSKEEKSILEDIVMPADCSANATEPPRVRSLRRHAPASSGGSRFSAAQHSTGRVLRLVLETARCNPNRE